jgi:hypothetical protein
MISRCLVIFFLPRQSTFQPFLLKSLTLQSNKKFYKWGYKIPMKEKLQLFHFENVFTSYANYIWFGSRHIHLTKIYALWNLV